MITAEHCPDVRREIDRHSSGGLPHNVGSCYGEFLIVNYLNEDIYGVDYLNHVVRIARYPIPQRDARKLEIRHRAHLGARSHDRITGVETTPSQHGIIAIPYDLLRAQPIFVEEINAVLCFNDQLSSVKHPHSKAAIAERVGILKQQTAEAMAEAPFVVIANDPTGKISELFIEINGSVCATKVTNFEEEDDTIIIGLRNKETSVDLFTTHRSTFTQLYAKDDRIWQIGEFRLSFNRAWFEQALAVERAKKPDTVPVIAVGSLIKEAREVDGETIRRLTDELKESKRQSAALESAFQDIKNSDYPERQLALDRGKLELEHMKLQRARESAIVDKEVDKLKLRKEIITVAGNVFKTIAIMVPLGLGVYKAIQAIRKT